MRWLGSTVISREALVWSIVLGSLVLAASDGMKGGAASEPSKTHAKHGVQAFDAHEEGEEVGWRGGDGRFVLVTGASNNHYVSMMNMIASARETYAGDIVAWDLGLSADEIDDFVMHQGPNLELRTFNYSAYPAHIQAPGATSASLHTYAWKPAIIHEMLQEAEQVLWIDAGSLVTRGLSYIRLHIAQTGFFATKATSTIGAFTHASMLRRYDAHHLSHLPQAASGLVGVDRRRGSYSSVVLPWRACALIPDCMAPPGFTCFTSTTTCFTSTKVASVCLHPRLSRSPGLYNSVYLLY